MPIAELMATDMLQKADQKYHLKIFENISQETVSAMTLIDRLRLVGAALKSRTDYAGFILGRKMIDQVNLLEENSTC